MDIEELKQPIWLIQKGCKVKERITHLNYLQVATSLSIKENALQGCYLFDDSKRIFIITEVQDLGNYNKPWKFEFFNPMRKIKLTLVESNDLLIKEKINLLLKEKDDNEW